MRIRSITKNAMDKKFSIRQFSSPEHPYIAFPQKNLAVLDISRFTTGEIGPQSRLLVTTPADDIETLCDQYKSLLLVLINDHAPVIRRTVNVRARQPCRNDDLVGQASKMIVHFVRKASNLAQ